MNKTKIFLLMLLGCIAFASCGESLEDTYAEFTGGGERRYLGKCTDIEAISGWKRIILGWKNNADPTIKHTKIVWRNGDEADSVIVDRGVDSLNINSLGGKELIDGTYEVTLTATDDKGNSSIPQTTYCRPFTPSHESVIGFTRIVSKIYILKHRLILSTTDWSDEVKSASVSYTKQDGQQAVLELTPEIANSHFYLVPDVIDDSKPITLKRRGELPECGDIIDFDPEEIDKGKTYDSGFRQEMMAQSGLTSLTGEWANSVQTLYFDYDISTLVDIMNLPNLKRVVLGSHRYQLASGINDATYGQSTVTDVEATNFAIKLMGQLCGTEVDIYNKHYQGLTGSNVIRKGMPKQPSVNFINLGNAAITNSQDHDIYKSYVERLIDGDLSTYWDPMPMQSFASYDLVIDLRTARSLKGLRIVQRTFSNTDELSISPSMARIYVSNDNARWYSATYQEDSSLGKSNGESTYVNFTPEIAASQYRYVKVTVNAGSYRGYFYTQLAELSVY